MMQHYQLKNNTGRGVIVYRWQYDAGTGCEACQASFRDYLFLHWNRVNKILDNNCKVVPVADCNWKKQQKNKFRRSNLH
jgi:hypothetical protein